MISRKWEKARWETGAEPSHTGDEWTYGSEDGLQDDLSDIKEEQKRDLSFIAFLVFFPGY